MTFDCCWSVFRLSSSQVCHFQRSLYEMRRCEDWEWNIDFATLFTRQQVSNEGSTHRQRGQLWTANRCSVALLVRDALVDVDACFALHTAYTPFFSQLTWSCLLKNRTRINCYSLCHGWRIGPKWSGFNALLAVLLGREGQRGGMGFISFRCIRWQYDLTFDLFFSKLDEKLLDLNRVTWQWWIFRDFSRLSLVRNKTLRGVADKSTK